MICVEVRGQSWVLCLRPGFSPLGFGDRISLAWNLPHRLVWLVNERHGSTFSASECKDATKPDSFHTRSGDQIRPPCSYSKHFTNRAIPLDQICYLHLPAADCPFF